ncbi:hypothetical protein C8F01DRAFT_552033 [Mycena amicta]|nr:hypothetical protein C8F01DRAFT_552033 [Mycena amicta]
MVVRAEEPKTSVTTPLCADHQLEALDQLDARRKLWMLQPLQDTRRSSPTPSERKSHCRTSLTTFTRSSLLAEPSTPFPICDDDEDRSHAHPRVHPVKVDSDTALHALSSRQCPSYTHIHDFHPSGVKPHFPYPQLVTQVNPEAFLAESTSNPSRSMRPPYTPLPISPRIHTPLISHIVVVRIHRIEEPLSPCYLTPPYSPFPCFRKHVPPHHTLTITRTWIHHVESTSISFHTLLIYSPRTTTPPSA